MNLIQTNCGWGAESGVDIDATGLSRRPGTTTGRYVASSTLIGMSG